MKAGHIDGTARVWAIDLKLKSPPPADSKLASPDTTRTPDAQMQSPSAGQRTSAASSMLSAKKGDYLDQMLADLQRTDPLLAQVADILTSEAIPDAAAQEKLMAIAAKAGEGADARDIDPETLAREQQRVTDSPMSPEARAWLFSGSPLPSAADLLQRVCIAKAHLAIDPLLSRELAGNVGSSVNLRGSMMPLDNVRIALRDIANRIDLIDGIRARQ